MRRGLYTRTPYRGLERRLLRIDVVAFLLESYRIAPLRHDLVVLPKQGAVRRHEIAKQGHAFLGIGDETVALPFVLVVDAAP
jgi:hypothetical protein